MSHDTMLLPVMPTGTRKSWYCRISLRMRPMRTIPKKRLFITMLVSKSSVTQMSSQLVAVLAFFTKSSTSSDRR